MLPPFIIEQIRKKEQEERVVPEQPRLELPLPPRLPAQQKQGDDDEGRGVIILDI
jgi:hypothetical protein